MEVTMAMQRVDAATIAAWTYPASKFLKAPRSDDRSRRTSLGLQLRGHELRELRGHNT
jgi:hypothetical protein